MKWLRWLAVIGSALWVAGYLGAFTPLRRLVDRLANDPVARQSFTDETAQVDALIALLSFIMLTPFALFVLLVIVIFVLVTFAAFVAPYARLIGIPDRVSLPVVLMGLGCVAYLERGLWVPWTIHTLGLVARAYVVWSGTVPPVPR